MTTEQCTNCLKEFEGGFMIQLCDECLKKLNESQEQKGTKE